MTLSWLPGLLVLFAIPIVWWLHRRARGRGEVTWPAFFLLPRSDDGAAQGHDVREPILLAIRALALAWLALAAAGVAGTAPAGTTVLAAAPAPIDPSWPTPVTVYRAGHPPTEVRGSDWPVVEGPIDWGAAVAAVVEESARLVVVRRRPETAITGAAAGVDVASGEALVVVDAARGGEPPRIDDAAGRRVSAIWASGAWRAVGALAPGPALVRGADGVPWPVCVPDPSPVRVAPGGWPPAMVEVVDALPGLVWDEAAPEWRAAGEAVKPAGVEGVDWAPFRSVETRIGFGFGAPERAAAPFHFQGDLPPPGALVRRWRGLPVTPGAEILARAAESPVVDRTPDQRGGWSVRFGFEPGDSDLTATAGWPVLVELIAARTREARARCRVVVGGRPLALEADAEVEIVDPSGARRRTVRPGPNGRVVLTGLDVAGIWQLQSGGRQAALAVQPDRGTGASGPGPDLPARSGSGSEPEAVSAIAHAIAFVLVVVAGWWSRGRSALPAIVLAAAAFASAVAGTSVGRGAPGAVVLVADVSASVPSAALGDAVAGVEARLDLLPRVDADDAVRRVHQSGAPRPPASSSLRGTRLAGALDVAAGLAGAGGAIVLVSDGRVSDLPHDPGVPVFPLPIGAERDAAVLDARAVRLGDTVVLRAALRNAGAARIGGSEWPAEPPIDGVARVVARLPVTDTVEVRVEVPGDPIPENDRLLVPVEGAPGRAVVLSRAGQAWAERAGYEVAVSDATALAGGEVALHGAAIAILADVSADRLPDAAVDRLERFVRSGGLLMLAGRTGAFGPGGWAGAPVERLSPLVSDPAVGGAARGTAVALLIDRSGSMAEEAGGIGLRRAAELAGRIAGALGRPEDRVAVLAFGARVEVLLPPTPVERVRSERLPVPAVARGGTRLVPALERARRLLAPLDVRRRIVVVLSDGRFADAARLDDAPAVPSDTHLIGVLTGERVDDDALRPLVARSGGRIVQAQQADLERLVTGALLDTGRGGLLAAGGAVRATGGWSARLVDAPPPIAERVRVGARPDARVLARVDGEPLLAEWSVGLGRVVALASDRWTLSESQWAALFAPGRAAASGAARLRVVAGCLELEVAPELGPPSAPARIRWIDAGPAVSSTRAEGASEVGAGWHTAGPWRRVAPGRYRAEMPTGPPGRVAVRVDASWGPLEALVGQPVTPELSRTGVDRPALTALARLTGGRVLDGPADVGLARAAVRAPGGRPLAPILSLLAAFALLAHVWAWSGGAGARLGLSAARA